MQKILNDKMSIHRDAHIRPLYDLSLAFHNNVKRDLEYSLALLNCQEMCA